LHSLFACVVNFFSGSGLPAAAAFVPNLPFPELRLGRKANSGGGVYSHGAEPRYSIPNHVFVSADTEADAKRVPT